MRKFRLAAMTAALTAGAALAAVPVPTAQELQDLQSVPASGYIVYGLGAVSSDDYAANGIWRIDLRSITAVNLSATGRVPIVHPANGNLIAFAQPVTPGSTSFNIVNEEDVVIDPAAGGMRHCNLWKDLPLRSPPAEKPPLEPEEVLLDYGFFERECA